MFADIFTNGKFHHHAYLLHSDTFKEAVSYIEQVLQEKYHFPRHNNPDFWIGEFTTFGVDEGRELARLHLLSPLSHTMKVFVVAAQFFTIEAQNALLKIIEEPSTYAYFFLVTSNPDILLPTLRSRLWVIEFLHNKNGNYTQHRYTGTGGAGVGSLAASYLQAHPVHRMELVRDIIDRKDKTEVLKLVESLEELVAAQVKHIKSGSMQEYQRSIQNLMRAKQRLYSRAPSVKMILEHLSLVLPPIKVQ